MERQTFFRAYLNDIKLINEDRNFFGTFKCPNDLKDLNLDAEEL